MTFSPTFSTNLKELMESVCLGQQLSFSYKPCVYANGVAPEANQPFQRVVKIYTNADAEEVRELWMHILYPQFYADDGADEEKQVKNNPLEENDKSSDDEIVISKKKPKQKISPKEIGEDISSSDDDEIVILKKK